MDTTRAAIRAVVVALAALAALAVPAGAALASCMLDERPIAERIADAEVVFVGTVTAVQDDGRAARFEVLEIWRGPHLEDPVVHGGPGEAGVATSVDRTWQVGTTYLVVPTVGDDGLRDDACSPTREWSEDLAAARPADARLIEDSDDPPAALASPTPWVVAGVGGAIVLVGGVWLARRRRPVA